MSPWHRVNLGAGASAGLFRFSALYSLFLYLDMFLWEARGDLDGPRVLSPG